MNGMGIDQLRVQHQRGRFLHLLNGKNLPYVTWADGRINNVLDLALQSGMLDAALGGMDIETRSCNTSMRCCRPYLASQISLNINFP